MFCRNVLTQGIKFVRLFQKKNTKKNNKIYQQLIVTLSTAKTTTNNINNVNKTMQTICGVSFLLIVLRIVTHRPGFFQHFTIPLELNNYLYMYIHLYTYILILMYSISFCNMCRQLMCILVCKFVTGSTILQ